MMMSVLGGGRRDENENSISLYYANISSDAMLMI